MSPAKTIETMAEHLTECLGNEDASAVVVDRVSFGVINELAFALSGFKLLRLFDADGVLVGFTPDKRAKILPITAPDGVVDTPKAAG